MSTSAAIYVSTSGNNRNPGTLSKPVKTISQASLIAKPGDTVYVEGGKYIGSVTLSSSGTASANINYMLYQGQHVILDGSSLLSGKDVVSIYGNYINFGGFDVQNGPGHGIIAYDTHNDAITGNSVHDDKSGGIWVGGDTTGISYSNTIYGNTVYNNVMNNQSRTASSGWSQGITAENSNNAVISNNTVYDNYGEGIGSILSSNVAITQNIVHDNYSVNIYLDNTSYSTVRDNFVYSSGVTSFFANGQQAVGIGAAVESYASQLPLRGDIITSNIDVGDLYGFYYGNYGYGGGMQGALIANNDFINETGSAIRIEYSAGSSGNSVDNNISFRELAGAIASGSPSGFSFFNNLWSGGSANGFAGATDVFGNPGFADPGGFLPNDYMLSAGSPAIGEGKYLSQVTTNLFGSAWPNGVNAGAI